MFKLLSLSSAKDYAGWKHNVGMAGLEWFKPLRGVMRIMDGDLYKNNKNRVHGIISKSKLLHQAATRPPANEQERPCVERLVHSARPATAT